MHKLVLILLLSIPTFSQISVQNITPDGDNINVLLSANKMREVYQVIVNCTLNSTKVVWSYRKAKFNFIKKTAAIQLPPAFRKVAAGVCTQPKPSDN